MAPKRVLGKLIRRPTRHGDSFYVGHAEHARLTLHFHEIRLDADGEPVEVWRLTLEVTHQHGLGEEPRTIRGWHLCDGAVHSTGGGR